jgi:hypothetical protein
LSDLTATTMLKYARPPPIAALSNTLRCRVLTTLAPITCSIEKTSTRAQPLPDELLPMPKHACGQPLSSDLCHVLARVTFQDHRVLLPPALTKVAQTSILCTQLLQRRCE